MITHNKCVNPSIVTTPYLLNQLIKNVYISESDFGEINTLIKVVAILQIQKTDLSKPLQYSD